MFCESRFAQFTKPVRPLGSLHLAIVNLPTAPFLGREKYFSEPLSLVLGAKYLLINTVKLHEHNVYLCPETSPQHLPRALPRVLHSTDAAHTPSHYRLPCRGDISAVISIQ